MEGGKEGRKGRGGKQGGKEEERERGKKGGKEEKIKEDGREAPHLWSTWRRPGLRPASGSQTAWPSRDTKSALSTEKAERRRKKAEGKKIGCHCCFASFALTFWPSNHFLEWRNLLSFQSGGVKGRSQTLRIPRGNSGPCLKGAQPPQGTTPGERGKRRNLELRETAEPAPRPPSRYPSTAHSPEMPHFSGLPAQFSRSNRIQTEQNRNRQRRTFQISLTFLTTHRPKASD